jgi:hypothetical protein
VTTSFHRAPLGNLEGDSFTGDFERWMIRVSVSLEAPLGTWGRGGGPSTGKFENSLKEGSGCGTSLSLWELR